MASEVIDELRRALGDAVSTDAGVRDAARIDASGWRTDSAPDAVVSAASVADVQAVLRIASATGTPVVTRGAGTGLAGGANGCRGQIVLDTTRMDRVLEIDQANELAVVEPGVINDDLNRALAPHGLWYSPDPASKAISTIGGNIATGAGGLLCAKYGVTREAVLGLVVVLADGSLLRTGHRTVKGVTGYDLTALLTGSEGTLGVIVEATLRLRPAPRHEPVTIAAAYPDVESAAAGAAAVVRAHLRPAMLELLEPGGLRRIRSFLGDEALAGTPLAADAAPADAAFLLAQTDGPAAPAEAAEVAAALASAGGSVALAADAAEGSGCSPSGARSTAHWRRPARCSSRTCRCRAPSCRRCSARSRASARRTAWRSRPSRTRATATCTRTSCTRATRCPRTSGRRPTSCSARPSRSAARSPASTAWAC
ncbi:hypothetical protein GCM10025877_29440 [Agromyces mangrovi Wang et al. 2018]|nr:hypothetical protein GCM10025877_29440 [Agromyces mangrovi]